MIRFARAIVVDLEVNCDSPSSQNKPAQDIIEIGAVPIDMVDCRIIRGGMLDMLVKPHTPITQYCSQLTGLSNQELGVHGIESTKAISLLGDLCRDTTWLSWGGIERNLLTGPDFEHHLDLQKWFCLAYGVKQRISLRAAMKMEQLEFAGKEHQALNDAFHAARLLIKMISGKTVY